MTTETLEQDMLDYVREHLKALPSGQLLRLAVDTDMSERTVRNVMKGVRDVKYTTVKRLHKALKDAEASEAQAATHGNP